MEAADSSDSGGTHHIKMGVAGASTAIQVQQYRFLHINKKKPLSIFYSDFGFNSIKELGFASLVSAPQTLPFLFFWLDNGKLLASVTGHYNGALFSAAKWVHRETSWIWASSQASQW